MMEIIDEFMEGLWLYQTNIVLKEFENESLSKALLAITAI